MEWWQRSISSNTDIRGACTGQPALYFPEIKESIIHLVPSGDKHESQTRDLIHSVLPNVKVEVIEVNNPHEAIDAFEQLKNLDSKIVISQWHTSEKNTELEKLPKELVVKNDHLLLFSAGNKNLPFGELSPLSSPYVLKVGSYNRSGEISTFCNEVPCSFYMPGTSIQINERKHKGTSIAVVIAAIAILIIKHKNNIKHNKYFYNRNTVFNHIPQHGVCDIGEFDRLIISRVYRELRHRPKKVQMTKIASIVSGVNVSTMYIDWPIGAEVPTRRPLIDLYGDALVEIRNENGDITIPLSGGIDSNAIAQAALKRNIPFSATIMRYNYKGDVRNMHDISHAINFCGEKNIPIKYVDLNVEEFYFNEEFLRYVADFYTYSPQLAAHLWMLDQIDECPVLPGEPPRLGPNNMIVLPILQQYCYSYFFHKTRKPGVPHLFLYDLDILYNSLMINKDVYKLTHHNRSYEKKTEYYERGGFEVRTTSSQTGFENLKSIMQGDYPNIYRVYDSWFRYPSIFYIKNARTLKLLIDDNIGKLFDDY
jgi:hypothetical protein